MTEQAVPVTLHILNKEYKIACPADEQDELLASAQLLDQQMRELRDSGKVIGPDRIAVVAALNLAHELKQLQKQNSTLCDEFFERLIDMRHKIEHVLGNS